MKSEKILLIAFDGLDYNLIKEFCCKNLMLKEFGKINNYTGINEIMTSELFASFITGKYWKEHGIEGLKISNQTLSSKIVESLYFPLLTKFKFYSFLFNILKRFFNYKKYKPTKRDLKADTIFEKIKNSKAMFVPSYNPSPFWTARADWEPLDLGYSLEEAAESYNGREFRYRKEKFWEELNLKSTRSFLMCHFHKTDTIQHFFGDRKVGTFDKNKLKKLYKETDKFAKKIYEKALNKGYDYIIFMSDHGLPSEIAHNKNAFYSCNKKLFPNKKPKIIDFYGKFLELTGYKKESNIKLNK